MPDRDPPDDESRSKQPEASESADATAEGERDSVSESDASDAAGEDEAEAREAAAEEPRKTRRTGKKSRARNERREEGNKGGRISTASAGMIAVATLAAGVAGGWFGHIQQAKAKLLADSAPAAAGSGAARGPCGAWEQKLCSTQGQESAVCQQAKAASEVLTPSTCTVALESMPATLAMVKANRVPCDKLMTKLCADLPPGSQACNIVKEKTPAFPFSRCTEMLTSYDEVLANLKQLDEQLAGQGAPSPHGGPRMMMPPGGPGGPASPPGGPGVPH